jgi:hypothetical protein
MARTAKAKHTFMLHDPATMACVGKYNATDYRYAALKAASRGHTDILLRMTNTKEVRRFKGAIEQLAEPKIIKRGDRSDPIVYNKKPTVKEAGGFVFDGTPPSPCQATSEAA